MALTVQELLRHQEDLEACIRDAIVREVQAFEARTGYTPCSISVELIPRQFVGHPRPRYTVGGVRTDVNIRE